MYFRALLLTSLTVFIVVITVNIIVDPYRILYPSTTDVAFPKKPYAQSEIYLNKFIGLKNTKAKTLLFGNSKVLWGLHASDSAWPDRMSPVYNASIPAANVHTALKYLEYKLHNSRVDTVVLGIDYFSALVRPNHPPEEPVIIGDYQKYLEEDWGSFTWELGKRLTALDGIIDSVLTVLERSNEFSPDITVDGDYPVNEYRKYVSQKGHGVIFRDYLKSMSRKLAGLKRVFSGTGRDTSELRSLESLVQTCNRYGVRLIIFIHPYHNQLMDLVFKWDRLQEISDWKSEIVNLSNRYDVELWDFSQKGKYTTELVPSIGDNRPMKWFWEPGHYKSRLGNEIIKRMLSTGAADLEFGELLTGKTSAM